MEDGGARDICEVARHSRKEFKDQMRALEQMSLEQLLYRLLMRELLAG